ncbi:MAG TPA: hypothetical protein VK327_16655 [Candidatus Paceibacterota bacterium]|nr:hypothetical protein [Candidatus Paceibacterota bacterium]
MRRFRNRLFALAAFFWLPVSAHCLLESVPGLEFLRCEPEASASHDPAKDCSSCCSVEKSQYHAETIRVTVPDFLPLIATPALPVVRVLPAEVSLGILTAAPPEFPASRHFLLRAALLPRAPSLAS